MRIGGGSHYLPIGTPPHDYGVLVGYHCRFKVHPTHFYSNYLIVQPFPNMRRAYKVEVCRAHMGRAQEWSPHYAWRLFTIADTLLQLPGLGITPILAFSVRGRGLQLSPPPLPRFIPLGVLFRCQCSRKPYEGSQVDRIQPTQKRSGHIISSAP